MIAAPLWTPRSGAWWRLPRFSSAELLEMFTAGKLQRDPATGKVKRNPDTGKIKRNTDDNTDCCCEELGPNCTSCAQGSPAQLRVVLSGISICTCNSGHTVHFDPNGTWDLDRDPANQCRYYLGGVATGIDTGSTTLTIYTTIACTTVSATSNNFFISFEANYGSGGGFTDTAFVVGVGVPAVNSAKLMDETPFFLGKTCYETLTINSSGNDACGGSGGQAIVSLVP